MSAIDNFELALAAQLHEQSQWLLGERDEASPDQSIRCLGALSVRIKSEPVVMTGRARDVVCALLTRPTAQAPAAVIASELWPHGELDYALGALNTTLYRMRRRNGLSDHRAPRWVSVDEPKVVRGPTSTRSRYRYRISTAALKKSVHRVHLSALADFACAIYRGPLLEDEALESVASARTRPGVRLIDVVQRIEARLEAKNIGSGWTESLCAIDPQARIHRRRVPCFTASSTQQRWRLQNGPARSGKSPARPLAKARKLALDRPAAVGDMQPGASSYLNQGAGLTEGPPKCIHSVLHGKSCERPASVRIAVRSNETLVALRPFRVNQDGAH